MITTKKNTNRPPVSSTPLLTPEKQIFQLTLYKHKNMQAYIKFSSKILTVLPAALTTHRT